MSLNFYTFFIFFLFSLALIFTTLRNKYLALLSTVFLVVLSSILFAWRPITESVDTLPYNTLFNDIDEYFRWNFSFGRTAKISMENWFVNLTKFLSCFSFSSRVFFFYISIINQVLLLSSLMKLLKVANCEESIDFALLYFLAFPYFIVIYSSAVLRAGLCIPFCVFGIAFFLEKKYIRSFLFLLLSIEFHLGALIFIICLLFAFLLLKIFDLDKLPVLHLFVFVFYVLGGGKYFIRFICFALDFILKRLPGSYLFDRFSNLLLFFSDNTNGIVSMRNILYFLEVFFILVSLKRNYLIKNILVIGGVFIFLFSQVTGLSRITDYCFVLSIVCFYMTINTNSRTSFIKRIEVYGFSVLNIIQAFQILGYTSFVFLI